MLQRVNDEESTKFNRLNTHPGQTFDPMRHRTEVTKKNQKMFFSAMKSREQFDYGINAAERAEFAHRRVKDEYLDNWMTTDPNENNVPGVDLRSPLTRQKIAQERSCKFAQLQLSSRFSPAPTQLSLAQLRLAQFS